MPGIILHDLQYAWRVLRKNTGFAATTIVTLALAIGASTLVFSVVNAVLLNPLDYSDPAHIYRVYTVDSNGLSRGSVGRIHIDPLAESTQTVQAAFYGFSSEAALIAEDGTAYAVNEYRASDGFFGVFTDALALGRGFEPADDVQTAVLSHQVWRDLFASAPDIVGSVALINGGQVRVIGVTRPGFEYPEGVGIWTKIYTGPGSENLFNLQGFVRTTSNVSQRALQAELDVVAGRVGSWPDGRALQFVARPLLLDVVGDFRPTLLLVSGATVVLLLIACFNVANLLFARGLVRASEIAVREALGAKTRRIFQQLLTETGVLCLAGGLLGLGIAVAGVRVLQALGPDSLPRLDTLSLDRRVFMFAAACALVTAIAVGVAPALRASKANLVALMNEGRRAGLMVGGRQPIFAVMVVAEIALAVVLVTGAGLLVRSYGLLVSVDAGFNPARMLTLVLNVPGRLDITDLVTGDGGALVGYRGSGYLPLARFYQELTDRIEAVPGVAAAGAASSAPLHQGVFPVNLAPYVLVGDSASAQRLAYGNQVAPEFFTALNVRPVSGRLLESSDGREAPGVAVINETFARVHFAGEDPIGRRVKLPNPAAWKITGVAFQLGERVVDEVEIVGVIPDLKQSNIADPVQPAIYVPHAQWTVRRMAIVVRAATDDPESLIPAIRAQLAEMDSAVPATFAVYSDVIASSVARQKLGAIALAVFGLVSLVLAAVGVFGLVSYSASQRSGEVAVRAALGADRGDVLKMFVTDGLRLVGIGVIAGIAGAIALGQLIASQLYQVSALDPLVFAIVLLTMLGVTVVASYLPAHRAAKAGVSAALRES